MRPRLRPSTTRRERARAGRGTMRVLAAIALGALAVGVGVGLLIVGIANLRSSARTTLRGGALLA